MVTKGNSTFWKERSALIAYLGIFFPLNSTFSLHGSCVWAVGFFASLKMVPFNETCMKWIRHVTGETTAWLPLESAMTPARCQGAGHPQMWLVHRVRSRHKTAQCSIASPLCQTLPWSTQGRGWLRVGAIVAPQYMKLYRNFKMMFQWRMLGPM